MLITIYQPYWEAAVPASLAPPVGAANRLFRKRDRMPTGKHMDGGYELPGLQGAKDTAY